MGQNRYVVEVNLRALFNADVRSLLNVMTLDDELFFDIVLRYWLDFEFEDERKNIEQMVWRYVIDMVGDDQDPKGEGDKTKDPIWNDFNKYFSSFIDCLYEVFGKLRPYIHPFLRGNTRNHGIEPILDGIYHDCVVFTFEEYTY